MIRRLEDPGTALPLFAGWPEAILWSCLQGVMGAVYAEGDCAPASAVAALGDFCFFGGTPSPALAAFRPPECGGPFAILVPPDARWSALLARTHAARARSAQRYAIKKEAGIFNPGLLRHYVASLAPGYALEPIGRALYERCMAQDWSRDLVAQFPDYAAYRRLGLGMAVTRDGLPVSGASSYCAYRGGIEIEIDTHRDHRRRGLATACGAGLILECLRRGLYPSWDAHNPGSVALAEKLGYHFDHAYPVLEVHW